MGKRVGINQLASAVDEILEEYVDDINELADKVGKKCADAGRKELRATSPRRTGAYASSWIVTKDKSGVRVGTTSYTIHSKKPGLPHLLENGHALRGGGRSRAIVHIAPVEEKVVQEYQRGITQGISKL